MPWEKVPTFLKSDHCRKTRRITVSVFSPTLQLTFLLLKSFRLRLHCYTLIGWSVVPSLVFCLLTWDWMIRNVASGRVPRGWRLCKKNCFFLFFLLSWVSKTQPNHWAKRMAIISARWQYKVHFFKSLVPNKSALSMGVKSSAVLFLGQSALVNLGAGCVEICVQSRNIIIIDYPQVLERRLTLASDFFGTSLDTRFRRHTICAPPDAMWSLWKNILVFNKSQVSSNQMSPCPFLRS